MKIYILSFVFSFVFMSLGWTQEKVEREYRIKTAQVPSKATQFLKDNFGDAKMKWYREESLKGQSIEAKGYIKRELYSIEFDTLGNLQDVEMRIKFTSLSNKTKDKIETALKAKFSKLKIVKVQAQWLVTAAKFKSSKAAEILNTENVSNYEIVLRGNQAGKTSYFEVLFTKNGDFVKQSRIVERNNHHMLY